jgi:hypothetical protein
MGDRFDLLHLGGTRPQLSQTFLIFLRLLGFAQLHVSLGNAENSFAAVRI